MATHPIVQPEPSRRYLEAYRTLTDGSLTVGEYVQIGRFYALRVPGAEYEVYLTRHTDPIRTFDVNRYETVGQLQALFWELCNRYWRVVASTDDNESTIWKLAEWAGPHVVTHSWTAELYGEHCIHVKEAPPRIQRS